jgi:hypothetical protein
VMPPHGRSASAKVRLYMDYVADLLGAGGPIGSAGQR